MYFQLNERNAHHLLFRIIHKTSELPLYKGREYDNYAELHWITSNRPQHLNRNLSSVNSELDAITTGIKGSRTPRQPAKPNGTSEACEPIRKVIFIKIHKTGSTTLASILGRFGYLRNLNFAFGKTGNTLSYNTLFRPSLLYKFFFTNTTRIEYDMLINHVRYNRREMDALISHVKYISIIRNPVSHLESAFGFFSMWKSLNITTGNPFETFLMDPRKFYAMKKAHWMRSRNGLLFGLGFDHKNDENITAIVEKVDELSTELDLMMMTEYFDESLILLRRLLCWDYEDILYVPHVVRSQSHRFEVSQDMAEKIRSWTAGDVMLYNHFNRTFWKKVVDYGPTFQNDLAYFQSLKTKAVDECVNESPFKAKGGLVEELAPKTKSKYCKDLTRITRSYCALILREMKKRVLRDTSYLKTTIQKKSQSVRP